MFKTIRFGKSLFLSIFFFSLCLFSCKSYCEAGKPFYVLASIEHGIFADMGAMVGLLDHYESPLPNFPPCSGVGVEYGEKGLYFDPAKGPNYWQYYFEPISIGDTSANKVYLTLEQSNKFAAHGLFTVPIQRARELVRKYIRVKPFIHKKVNDFVAKNFTGYFIIGVHYRGTNKFLEAPLIPYEDMYKEVQRVIQRLGNTPFKIFVASDEQRFVDFMEEKFPNLIIKTEANRSIDGTPHYMEPKNQYQNGEDAVVDCLLLSNCHYLLRTSSNVSYFSTVFNPTLPVKNVSQTFFESKKQNKQQAPNKPQYQDKNQNRKKNKK